MTPPPVPPAAFTLSFVGNLWRVRSDDGAFQGTFTDRHTAVREATAEADAHPGRALVFRTED